ncbi:hypothetical protein DL546_002248 [Coniochaeta pulveracea]|uniref:DUF8021 domain-containing protein n=1 Tax=Coniochaeta pulveracea TaxID=177199 RepID=A0A420XY06_9PEZI|nr:hypothetical protein DL546_002248 [Coniochaeta pulveracea]
MAFFSPFVWASLIALSQGLPAGLSSCTRELLETGANAYIQAQASGNFSILQSSSSKNFTYYENNNVSNPLAGVLRLPLKIDHSRTTFDTVQCSTYTELISAGSKNPYVLGTQIRHDPTNGTLGISVIDTIASTTGAWLFNASKTLEHVLQESWTPLPPDKQVARDVLQATADAYLDMWSNATASNAVAWGEPCTRLEGSAYTGTGSPTDSCKPGIPSNHHQAPNIHRRYVIDEAMGSCTVFCLWQHMMNAADSHEFRLEGGKLRYVHTMTVCPGQTCRL